MDLRRKLSDDQIKEIKTLYKSGMINYTRLGLMFKVHPKTIHRVVDDDYRKECNEFNNQNWRKYKPDKKRHAEAMKRYRRRKNENRKNKE